MEINSINDFKKNFYEIYHHDVLPMLKELESDGIIRRANHATNPWLSCVYYGGAVGCTVFRNYAGRNYPGVIVFLYCPVDGGY